MKMAGGINQGQDSKEEELKQYEEQQAANHKTTQ